MWVEDLQHLVYQADDLLDEIVYEGLPQKVQITKMKKEALKSAVKVAAEQIRLAWGLEEDLRELRKWLLKVEAILRDINTRKLHPHSVKMWVENLQHLVYQADDLLDEIVYEGLCQKVQTKKMEKVRNFASPSNNAFFFRLKTAKEIKKVMNLLHRHYCEASPLGLVGVESVEPEIDLISQFRETISELDDHEVVGRDVEVESIVKQVIDSSNQQLAVLPIVGMGGLGKTTLAKLVFNHEMVTKHFDKTIWVCVSEPFVVNKILGEILQNLKGTSHGLDTREVLLNALQKEMRGQRYFLVLDDVWNENANLWDDLKCCLTRITAQSENSIVVTTRSADVAKIMGTLPSHHLSELSNDQCWSLFKEAAGACDLLMTSSLEDIRKELIKKIGGVPLVARVLGRAVKFEGDDERWVQMLESVARTPFPEESFVLPILKLSVDRLPSSSLKQCFAYCSKFPKDFLFEKEQMIQMWMAQGFIQPQEERNNITMKSIGDMYFKILSSRCLFQDAIKDDEGRITSFKMHDLIHDIACEVSSDRKLQLNPNNILDEELWKKGSEEVGSKLRTIMIDFYEQISHKIDEKMFINKIVNFVCLRVLKMYLDSTDKLPDSIGRLKHLRYLEIITEKYWVSSVILKLPSSIVLLYNLQTLRIKKSTIKNLPNDLKDLVNLRHLECPESLKKMPSCLSQLTQLQTLSSFVVGLEKGCSIAELGPLNNLKGSLKLFCLEKVRSKEEACTAKLVDKENLDELVFNWSFEIKNNSGNDLEVLEGLQPHENLRSLRIKSFAGKCLPNNIFVENLRVIELGNCKSCERLPMLGQLNNLKDLRIDGLNSVRSIGNEFYGNDSNQRTFFPKLERFMLRGMKSLEQWEEITSTAASNVTLTTFHHLKELRIEQCPKLLNIPDLFGGCDENDVEHLTLLTISDCLELTKLSNGLQLCHSIQHLEIDNVSNNFSINFGNKQMLSSLSMGPLHKLPEELANLINLREMFFSVCIQNDDLSFLTQLPSLKRLTLFGELGNNALTTITQVPEQREHLEYLTTALESLSLAHFGGIEVLPEWFGNFVSLETLSLGNCKKLKQLPSKEAMLRLTKLRELWVYDCPKLQLGERDTERAKLSHLPNINIVLNQE